MIGRLSGVVLERDPSGGRVLLDVQGVGYEVAVSLQTLSDVPEAGHPCALWIHTHVREDALALFGFARLESRAMFRMLTSVPKVGPKHALATLGGLPLPQLLRTVAEGDAGQLTKIPGIGKRTAEQIILTLKDKVLPLLLTVGDEAPVESAPTPEDGHPLRVDAEAMLIALGWKAKVVGQALDRVLEDAESTGAFDSLNLDELVRRALAQLMER